MSSRPPTGWWTWVRKAATAAAAFSPPARRKSSPQPRFAHRTVPRAARRGNPEIRMNDTASPARLPVPHPGALGRSGRLQPRQQRQLPALSGRGPGAMAAQLHPRLGRDGRGARAGCGTDQLPRPDRLAGRIDRHPVGQPRRQLQPDHRPPDRIRRRQDPARRRPRGAGVDRSRQRQDRAPAGRLSAPQVWSHSTKPARITAESPARRFRPTPAFRSCCVS